MSDRAATLRILILGDHGVGKSTLVKNLIKNLEDSSNVGINSGGGGVGAATSSSAGGEEKGMEAVAEKLVKALPLLSRKKGSRDEGAGAGNVEGNNTTSQEGEHGNKSNKPSPSSPPSIHRNDTSGEKIQRTKSSLKSRVAHEFDVWNLDLGEGCAIELFDFSKNAIELFPFFVSKRTLVIIVYDATTELTVSQANQWLKELDQVTRRFEMCPYTDAPSDTCQCTENPDHEVLVPDVLLVGTRLDQVKKAKSSEFKLKMQEHINADLAVRFPCIQGIFLTTSRRPKSKQMDALKRTIRERATQYRGEIALRVGKLPPAGVKLWETLQDRRNALPIFPRMSYEKMAQEFGLKKQELDLWTYFLVDIGFLLFINKSKIRVVQSGATVLLNNWVFLNTDWLADIYYLLWCFSKDAVNEQKIKLIVQKKEQRAKIEKIKKTEEARRKASEQPKNKEEEDKKVKELVKKAKKKTFNKHQFRNGGTLGVVKCNEMASVWNAKNIEAPEVKESILMLFEELDLIHFVYPKKQKMLILDEDLSTALSPKEEKRETTTTGDGGSVYELPDVRPRNEGGSFCFYNTLRGGADALLAPFSADDVRWYDEKVVVPNTAVLIQKAANDRKKQEQKEKEEIERVKTAEAEQDKEQETKKEEEDKGKDTEQSENSPKEEKKKKKGSQRSRSRRGSEEKLKSPRKLKDEIDKADTGETPKEPKSPRKKEKVEKEEGKEEKEKKKKGSQRGRKNHVETNQEGESQEKSGEGEEKEKKKKGSQRGRQHQVEQASVEDEKPSAKGQQEPTKKKGGSSRKKRIEGPEELKKGGKKGKDEQKMFQGLLLSDLARLARTEPSEEELKTPRRASSVKDLRTDEIESPRKKALPRSISFGKKEGAKYINKLNQLNEKEMEENKQKGKPTDKDRLTTSEPIKTSIAGTLRMKFGEKHVWANMSIKNLWNRSDEPEKEREEKKGGSNIIERTQVDESRGVMGSIRGQLGRKRRALTGLFNEKDSDSPENDRGAKGLARLRTSGDKLRTALDEIQMGDADTPFPGIQLHRDDSFEALERKESLKKEKRKSGTEAFFSQMSEGVQKMEMIEKQKERGALRREKLVKTKRHYFKTVYRNMASVNKDISQLETQFSDSSNPNGVPTANRMKKELLNVSAVADQQILVPNSLPRDVRALLQLDAELDNEKKEKEQDDKKEGKRVPYLLKLAGWLPPGLDYHENISEKQMRDILSSSNYLQQRIFRFNQAEGGFLSFGLFDRLVSKLMAVATANLVWRTGMLITNGEEKAYLECLVDKDELRVSVYGKEPGRMWHLLRFHIEDIALNVYGFKFSAFIPCCHCLIRNDGNPYLFAMRECELAVAQMKPAIYCLSESNSHPVSIALKQLAPDISLEQIDNQAIDFNEITIIKEIAKTNDSVVHLGEYEGQRVAVKEFILPESKGQRDSDSFNVLQQFRSEAVLMSGLDHPNVVKLVGICKTPLALIMEHMPDGNLYNYLKNNQEASWTTRLSIALDIANGMFFLHSMVPQIIHRDLKSLNILMNGTTAKVSDFGLSTEHAVGAKGRAVDNPLWLAPEVMRGEESSEKADVYSFAIVLWEIGTNKEPFSEFSFSFFSQIEDRIVKEKLRPTIPASEWPEGYVSLVKSCWQDNAYLRPSFFTIVETLEGLLSAAKKQKAYVWME